MLDKAVVAMQQAKKAKQAEGQKQQAINTAKANDTKSQFFDFLDTAPDAVLQDPAFIQKISGKIPGGATAESLTKLKATRARAKAQLKQLTPEQVSKMPQEALQSLAQIGITDPQKLATPKWVQDLQGLGKSVVKGAIGQGTAKPKGMFGAFAESNKIADPVDKEFQSITYADPKTGLPKKGIFDKGTGTYSDAEGNKLDGDVVATGINASLKVNPDTGLIERFDANTGEFISVQKTVGEFTPQQRQSLTSAYKALDGNTIFSEAKQGYNASKAIGVMLASDNPVATGTIKRQLAKASGEVGRLTEEDVMAFGGSQALFARIDQLVNELDTGTFTPENKVFMNELASIMAKQAQFNASREIGTQLGRLGSTSLFTPEQVQEETTRELERQFGGNVTTLEEEEVKLTQGQTIQKQDGSKWKYIGGDQKLKSSYKQIGINRGASGSF